MKKWTALLIALVMLVSAGTVIAETAASPDLYDLYDATETGKTSCCGRKGAGAAS